MRIKIVPVLIILILLLIGVVAWLLMSGDSLPFFSDKTSSVSGKLDVNGVVPSGGTVTITQKENNSKSEPVAFATGLSATDGDSWSFNDAQKGKTYEIQAQVVVNGAVFTASSPITVTAPADDEALVLNIEGKGQGSAVISGNVEVNGYIPSGATIVVKGRRLGATQFTTVASDLPGLTRQFMSYATAISGTTYEVEGALLNSQGTQIGSSNIITITAPAVNEVLTINSEAVAPTQAPTATAAPAAATQASQPTSPPAGSSVISGSINLNGAAPANSRIVVFQKSPSSPNYQVAVDNIAPIDGTTWSWNGAQNSTWYTVIAILKQRQPNGTDTDIADSPSITIAAPATNVILSINSGVSLSAPGGPITVNCQTFNGGPNQNNWNVQVSFQTVPSAQSYWLQIGTTNGAYNLTNTTQNSNGASLQATSTTFNNNTTYYARYAYANVPNVGAGNSQYSGFSSTTPLQCGN